jgi:exosortase D (VPLPA-CTERM-specific)
MATEHIQQGGSINAALPVWRPSISLASLIVVMLVLSIVPFIRGLDLMWDWWMGRPEYSHGILMPVLATFLIWQQRDRFERLPFTGSWWGVALTGIAALVLLLGKLASVLTLVQYAYVLTLGGLMLSLVGRRAAPMLLVPFFILVLMIPLPEFLFQNLTADLQLLSSKLGVAFIRLCGVSVFLEGNVIDLGNFKLEVAEACSGLRYLFPLMTLGFIMAYFYKAAMWKRAVIFLSSIPVTILMNSLRIGAIGMMVDRWGKSMAEGLLHDFEGWMIFMVSSAVLLLEIVMFSRIGRDARPWREIFGIELPASAPRSLPRAKWQANAPFIASSALVAVLVVISVVLPERVEKIPARSSFAEFPTQLESYVGKRIAMEAVYVETLKFDDYLLTDYQGMSGQPINFYVAWYNSQRGGQSTHSPRTCLPGGGWRIASLTRAAIPHVDINGGTLTVNRALIESGNNRQLVYYWFQQRGRVVTNEYAVKWYLFWDSLTRQRTDGALVRLIVSVPDGKSVDQIETELQNFVRVIAPKLTAFVPG